MNADYSVVEQWMPVGYNPEIDYVEEHLNWIAQHKNFRSTTYNNPYLDVMRSVYKHSKQSKNLLAFKFFLDDDYCLSRTADVAQAIHELNKVKINDDGSSNWAFITVGWNEQTVTPVKMQTVSQRIACFKYFSECNYVLEKHRENGEHHHTHFLVRLSAKYSASKLAQDIYKIKGIRDICLKSSFIDIKAPWNKKSQCQPYEVYYDYIRGIKKEAKMQYVKLDRMWRQENSFKDLY